MDTAIAISSHSQLAAKISSAKARRAKSEEIRAFTSVLIPTLIVYVLSQKNAKCKMRSRLENIVRTGKFSECGTKQEGNLPTAERDGHHSRNDRASQIKCSRNIHI